jgi:hypothetical protein
MSTPYYQGCDWKRKGPEEKLGQGCWGPGATPRMGDQGAKPPKAPGF